MKLQRLKSGMQSLPKLTIQRQPDTTIDPNSWRQGLTKTSERGYGWKWQKARAAYLSRPENVCCRLCQRAGIVTVATVVDHIIPHRGDRARFWDTSNWQPLCKPCHDSVKQAEERQTR